MLNSEHGKLQSLHMIELTLNLRMYQKFEAYFNTKSRKMSNLPPAPTSLLIEGHLHASEFSSHEISFKNYRPFLKTGINLRRLPPAHSRGAVSFSGLCFNISANLFTLSSTHGPV